MLRPPHFETGFATFLVSLRNSIRHLWSLLSRVAEAELEELVLSTLAAFFAIASVEWLRGELKLLRHSAMEMVLHTEDLSPRSTK